MRNLLIFGLCCLTMISCLKVPEQTEDLKPEANFDFEISEGKAPFTVVFIDKSKNAIEYEWDFGDGNTSQLRFPIIQFDQSGEYTVTLKVSNSHGEHQISKKLVLQNPKVKKVIVTKVIFSDFSPTKNGESWDSPSEGTYPDVFFKLSLNEQVVYNSPVKQNLSLSQLPVSWENSAGLYEVLNPNELSWGIVFYDKDITQDQKMVGVSDMGFDPERDHYSFKMKPPAEFEANIDVEIYYRFEY